MRRRITDVSAGAYSRFDDEQPAPSLTAPAGWQPTMPIGPPVGRLEKEPRDANDCGSCAFWLIFFVVMGAAITGAVLASINYSRNNDQDWLLQMQDLKDMVLMMNVTELNMELELQALKDMVLMMNVTDLRAFLDALGSQDSNSTAALIAKDMVLMGNVSSLDTRLLAEAADRLAKDMVLMDNVTSLDYRLAQEGGDRLAKDMTLMDDVAALQAKDMALMANVSSLDARLVQEAAQRAAKDATLMSDVSSLQGKDMTLMGDITNLQNKDIMFTSDIEVLQAKDMVLMAQISALTNVTTTLVVNGTVQDFKLVDLMMDAMAVEDRVEMAEALIANNTVKIAQNMMNINTLETYAITSVTAGGGISVTLSPAPSPMPGAGRNLQITNTGVTSVAAPTAQITATTSPAGAVTLTTPNPLLEDVTSVTTGPTAGITVSSPSPTTRQLALSPTTIANNICGAPTCAPSAGGSGFTALRGFFGAPTPMTPSPTGQGQILPSFVTGSRGIQTSSNPTTLTVSLNYDATTGIVAELTSPTILPTLAPSICSTPACGGGGGTAIDGISTTVGDTFPYTTNPKINLVGAASTGYLFTRGLANTPSPGIDRVEVDVNVATLAGPLCSNSNCGVVKTITAANTAGTTTGANVIIQGTGGTTVTRSGNTVFINPPPTPAPSPGGITSVTGVNGITTNTLGGAVTVQTNVLNRGFGTGSANGFHWCSIQYDDGFSDYAHVSNMGLRWVRIGRFVTAQFDRSTSGGAVGIHPPSVQGCRGFASLATYGISGGSCTPSSGVFCTCNVPSVTANACAPLVANTDIPGVQASGVPLTGGGWSFATGTGFDPFAEVRFSGLSTSSIMTLSRGGSAWAADNTPVDYLGHQITYFSTL